MLLTMFVPLPSWAATPDILLPEPFAVELPAGVNTMTGEDPAMKALLAGARAGGDRVTASLPRERIGPGAWRVILSAWETGVRDRPVARREAILMVLPHGVTPVGASGVGSAAQIARDGDGFIHMVWTDAWRPGAREGVMYRRARELPDGTVQFQTDILELGQHRGNWNTLPTVAAAGNAVHFAWQSGGTIWYRSLTKSGADWRWSDEIDTKRTSSDQGLAIVADATTVHILTSDGHYNASNDGGRTWTTEVVPFGTNPHLASVSLTIDRAGRPLAAASLLVSEASGRTGARWTLRIVRRIGAGAWQIQPGPLDGRTEWASADPPGDDVTCDSLRVQEDQGGAMHAVWQGISSGQTAFGVQAWYALRPSGGEWRPPIRLPQPDPVHGASKSYVAGVILDRDNAMPLTSRELHSGWRYRGTDSELELFRDGEKRAPPLPVAGFIRGAMTENEPAAGLSAMAASASPSLFHAADGRVWADMLTILSPAAIKAPAVVVWQHQDLTDWLRAAGQ
jgi:hypothetical protein